MFHSYQTKSLKIKNYSYSPLDQVGKGFSSIVYRGSNDQTSKIIFNLNQNLEQTVAIKVIDLKGIRDLAAKQMLNCQIQALTTLKHENVMKCFDVIKDQKSCYIITEFCNEGDLSDLLKKRKRLSESQVLPILKNIIDGYVQIGQKGFLHRDLKLANVLMHKKIAKIADFGFAKRFKMAKQKQKYNVGSPLYMAPEALQKNIYSIQNDIWSIGIMTFQLLHGRTPWQCKTQRQLINKMTRVPVSFTTKVSENLKKFIKRCLQVSDTKRMSLKQMKQWQFDIPSDINTKLDKKLNQDKQNKSQQNDIPLLTKKHSLPEPRKRALSQITNKFNIPTNQRKSLQKKPVLMKKASEAPPNHTNDDTNKLTKSRIDWNNNKITKQILLFRLYFKTWEKLNIINSNNTTTSTSSISNQDSIKVQNIMGNQTIRLVTMLKKLVCSVNIETNKKYNLKNYQQYTNSIINPSIKKYKEVIQQYFNRYTEKVTMQIIISTDSPSLVIKQYLRNIDKKLDSNKDLLLIHWLINLIGVSSENSRKSLQKILEPERQITRQEIVERIQIMVAC